MPDTTDPQPSLRAVFTVTIETRKGGDYYFDHDDLVRNVTPWIEGALEDRDDIRDVTVVEAETAAVLSAPADDLPARLEAVLTERFTELGNPFSAMRRHEKGPDGWPASHPVGPHHVAEVLRELMAVEVPAPNRAGGETQQGEAEADGTDPTRITVDGDGVLLHLPEITYLDTQVWSADIGLTTDALRALRDAATAHLADEAHPSEHTWAAELHDPAADEWVPGTRYTTRDRAVNHLAHARTVGPTWRDGTPTERRLVRATTTYTVEAQQPEMEA